MSQLSRASESRTGDHRPRLSDLRESGAIEQDADVVIFIYKPDNYTEEGAKSKPNECDCELIVAKNRNGACETVPVRWIGNITSFVNLAKDADAQSLERTLPEKRKKMDEQAEATVLTKEEIDDDLSDLF